MKKTFKYIFIFWAIVTATPNLVLAVEPAVTAPKVTSQNTENTPVTGDYTPNPATDAVGGTVDNTTTTNKDESVSISPSNNTSAVENKSVYNFLAPIGKIKCMNSKGIADQATGLDSNGCITNNIGTYLNFIFKLGIGLSAALAVLMLILGGVMYMGEESIFGKMEAKDRMKKAILGLFIALAAWALLNTINPNLVGITKDANGNDVSTQIKISSANIELDSNSIFVKSAADSARCTPVTSGPCTVSNLSSTFNSKAEAMSKICNIESSGNQNALSKTDKGSDGTVFSMGLFQINLLANGSIITDGSGISCSNLFVHTDGTSINGGDYIVKDSSGKYSYNAKLKTGETERYNKCKNILLDPNKNIAIANKLSLSAWKYSDSAVCPSAFQ